MPCWKSEERSLDLDDDFDLGSATNIGGVQQLSRLDRMHQLTGFGDPVYAEATITVHDYDIVMDISILNRTEYVVRARSARIFFSDVNSSLSLTSTRTSL